MLIRYGCSNYSSIGEYQEVLLTAAENKEESENSLICNDAIRDKLLPIIEIYGGNGSGKTNMLDALRFMVTRILQSSFGDTSRLSVSKFKLDENFKNEPSIFDIDFIFKGKHYHYGFSIKENIVDEEWLYLISYGARKSTTTLFYRESEAKQPFSFGKNLKGNNKNIASVTGKGCLYLSMAAKAEHPFLSEIYNYFESSYEFRFDVDLVEQSIGEAIYSNHLETDISKFVSLVDVGAVTINVTESDFDEREKSVFKSISSVMVDLMKDLGSEKEISVDDISEMIESNKQYKVKVIRNNVQGKEVSFTFKQESLGTKALISFLASAFQVLKSGGVFIVDEIESSLHTLLTLKLVELFAKKETNPNGAQLVFSTHETQLMNFDGVRRDEIWLTEKCRDGSTKIASLLEYSIDKRSNWRKGYFEGRFGAIPILGFVDDFNLFGEPNGSEKTS